MPIAASELVVITLEAEFGIVMHRAWNCASCQRKLDLAWRNVIGTSVDALDMPNKRLHAEKFVGRIWLVPSSQWNVAESLRATIIQDSSNEVMSSRDIAMIPQCLSNVL